jgi:hypothetical protein
MHKSFYDVDSNEIRTLMFPLPHDKSKYEKNATIRLDSIIKLVRNTNPDKKHLFIVGSCRSDCTQNISRARLGRRLSIASRQKNNSSDRLNYNILMSIYKKVQDKVMKELMLQKSAITKNELNARIAVEIPAIYNLLIGQSINMAGLFNEIKTVYEKGYISIKPNSRLYSLLLNEKESSPACGGGAGGGVPCNVPVSLLKNDIDAYKKEILSHLRQLLLSKTNAYNIEFIQFMMDDIKSQKSRDKIDKILTDAKRVLQLTYENSGINIPDIFK